MRLREACSESIGALDWNTDPTNLAGHLLSCFLKYNKATASSCGFSIKSELLPQVASITKNTHTSQYIRYENYSTDWKWNAHYAGVFSDQTVWVMQTNTQSVWVCTNAETELLLNHKKTTGNSPAYVHICAHESTQKQSVCARVKQRCTGEIIHKYYHNPAKLQQFDSGNGMIKVHCYCWR